MREVLLSRRWLFLTVLVVALQPAFAALGWWQWGRGARTHDIQNLGYAFQWWSFGLVAIGGWAKMLHTELKEQVAGVPESPAATEPTLTPAQRSRKRAVAAAVAQRGSLPAAEPDEADEELSAYNAYLAWLAANPRS